jgi:hypothetical protein
MMNESFTNTTARSGTDFNTGDQRHGCRERLDKGIRVTSFKEGQVSSKADYWYNTRNTLNQPDE